MYKHHNQTNMSYITVSLFFLPFSSFFPYFITFFYFLKFKGGGDTCNPTRDPPMTFNERRRFSKVVM